MKIPSLRFSKGSSCICSTISSRFSSSYSCNPPVNMLPRIRFSLVLSSEHIDDSSESLILLETLSFSLMIGLSSFVSVFRKGDLSNKESPLFDESCI